MFKNENEVYKLENQHNFSETQKSTEWNFWVRFLRKQIVKSTPMY